jgi:hypothetical protein
MNTKEFTKVTKTILGNLARKVAESAVHAAVFAFVSKKVTDFIDRSKEDKTNVRVNTEEKSNSSTETV